MNYQVADQLSSILLYAAPFLILVSICWAASRWHWQGGRLIAAALIMGVMLGVALGLGVYALTLPGLHHTMDVGYINGQYYTAQAARTMALLMIVLPSMGLVVGLVVGALAAGLVALWRALYVRLPSRQPA